MKQVILSIFLILAAHAGFSQLQGSIALAANAKDADGTITSVKWEVISGPTGWKFSNPATDATVFTVT